jgi:hypothetical protein
MKRQNVSRHVSIVVTDPSGTVLQVLDYYPYGSMLSDLDY